MSDCSIMNEAAALENDLANVPFQFDVANVQRLI